MGATPDTIRTPDGRRPCGRMDCERWFVPAVASAFGRQLYCTPTCKKLDRADRMREGGRCRACERPNPDAPAALCPDCRAKWTERERQNRARRRAAGLCSYCPRPAIDGQTRCLAHKLAKNRNQTKWRKTAAP